MNAPFEIGLYSFVENTPDPRTGKQISPAQRMREMLEEIELADQVGLDAFGIGEHHRTEYLSSAPAVILAAAAARTQRIHLCSAVSVLSSNDPVRVFQDFATLDLISNGRAEIVAGRGSFIESFPLFGYDLDLYHDLFAEKIELLLQLRDSEYVTWSGEHRPALDNRGVYPRPLQKLLPVWIAVGGTPQSVVRAAELGVPLAIAIIGGAWEQFAPFVRLYRDVLSEVGRDPQSLPVSINSHGFIADDSRAAMDIAWPAFSSVMDKIGRERGWSPMSRSQFEATCTPRGANFVGSPQQIVDKILAQHSIFGHQRLLLQLTVGSISHAQVMRAIELLGTVVAPAVRTALAG
ncbi:MAG: LLM class flavin-dependent oxidoreductase [Chloroflexi bacterium]|nr:LLM class flavin-dependent oxidoreductase [Chloroflexota bacterium]